ncbi:MAG TPA: acetate kinase [Lapillicoccus sp.]
MNDTSPAQPVLVVNAGSSSLKYQLVDAATGSPLAKGSVERIGERRSRTTHESSGETHTGQQTVASHREALAAVAEAFRRFGPSFDEVGLLAIGHRVVHGGDRFSDPVVVTDDVLAAIEELEPLAPLHNPANLEGIRVSRERFPDVPQVAVFDTAFHHAMPAHSYTYAVPKAWREEHLVRRYGFHGTSFAYVSRRAAAVLGHRIEDVNLVVLHLGNGASAAAIAGGRSVDTSMGLTPLEGLVMGTRSGDIDPGLFSFMVRTGMSADAVDAALNRESGLKGLSGTNDFREVDELVATNDPDGKLAFDVTTYRLRKYVGAYAIALGRLDALVFTAGIGEHAPRLRAAVCHGLGILGIELDDEANLAPGGDERRISTKASSVAVLVVPTNEELEIARQAAAVVTA